MRSKLNSLSKFSSDWRRYIFVPVWEKISDISVVNFLFISSEQRWWWAQCLTSCKSRTVRQCWAGSRWSQPITVQHLLRQPIRAQHLIRRPIRAWLHWGIWLNPGMIYLKLRCVHKTEKFGISYHHRTIPLPSLDINLMSLKSIFHFQSKKYLFTDNIHSLQWNIWYYAWHEL